MNLHDEASRQSARARAALAADLKVAWPTEFFELATDYEQLAYFSAVCSGMATAIPEGMKVDSWQLVKASTGELLDINTAPAATALLSRSVVCAANEDWPMVVALWRAAENDVILEAVRDGVLALAKSGVTL